MDTILTDIETRVLGSLIEKQVTTPEYYPLTLNALTLACNQKNNRNPVTSYSESQISDAVETLREKNLAYVFYGSTSRVPKYKHVMPEVMHLTHPELALMCVLMLRGAQTLGELRGNAARLHPGQRPLAMDPDHRRQQHRSHHQHEPALPRHRRDGLSQRQRALVQLTSRKDASTNDAMTPCMKLPCARVPLMALINPEIEVTSRDVVEDWEGCLSIPDIRGRVQRARQIIVRAFDRSGKKIELPASGFTARVIQHETDHLDGVLFLDRMTSLETLTYTDEFSRYWSSRDVQEE